MEVWPTPGVTALNGWMASLVREACLEDTRQFRRPLGPQEEWCLWLDAARALLDERDDPRPFIWSADALADALQRAARLCSEWRIDDAVLARYPTTEAQWLLSARRAVSAAARERGASASFEQGEWLLTNPLPDSEHARCTVGLSRRTRTAVNARLVRKSQRHRFAIGGDSRCHGDAASTANPKR